MFCTLYTIEDTDFSLIARQSKWAYTSAMRFLDHIQVDTPHSVGILWTSVRSVAETST
jgi:hypothetical protein